MRSSISFELPLLIWNIIIILWAFFAIVKTGEFIKEKGKGNKRMFAFAIIIAAYYIADTTANRLLKKKVFDDHRLIVGKKITIVLLSFFKLIIAFVCLIPAIGRQSTVYTVMLFLTLGNSALTISSLILTQVEDVKEKMRHENTIDTENDKFALPKIKSTSLRVIDSSITFVCLLTTLLSLYVIWRNYGSLELRPQVMLGLATIIAIFSMAETASILFFDDPIFEDDRLKSLKIASACFFLFFRFLWAPYSSMAAIANKSASFWVIFSFLTLSLLLSISRAILAKIEDVQAKRREEGLPVGEYELGSDDL